MRPRLIGACIIDTMPRGANMHVAWLDKTNNTIHAGGVLDVAFNRPTLFRYSTFGYVVDGEGNRLVHHPYYGGTPRDVTAAGTMNTDAYLQPLWNR